MTRSSLWQALLARGAVQGPAPVDDSVPWSLRLLFGLGAWLASLFTIAFIGFLFNDLLGDNAGRLTIAAFAGFGAWKLLPRGASQPFLSQVGLVLACLMQAMLLLCIIDDVRQSALAGLLVMLIGAIGYLLPSRLWRVWCTWLALFGLCWLLREVSPLFGLPVAVALAAGGAAWLWLHSAVLAADYEWLWPLALGLSLGTLLMTAWNPALPWAWLFIEVGRPLQGLTTASLCSAVLAVVNAWLVWRLTGAQARSPAALGATLLVLLVAAATFSTPAISAAVGLLLLGHGRAQPVLSVLGWGVLPFALSAHYYGLNWPLNLKALSMAMLGVLLLAARAWMLRQGQHDAVGGQTHA